MVNKCRFRSKPCPALTETDNREDPTSAAGVNGPTCRSNGNQPVPPPCQAGLLLGRLDKTVLGSEIKQLIEPLKRLL